MGGDTSERRGRRGGTNRQVTGGGLVAETTAALRGSKSEHSESGSGWGWGHPFIMWTAFYVYPGGDGEPLKASRQGELDLHSR